jgi:intracellular sulfur oxidation DsrE/DsrF family protein
MAALLQSGVGFHAFGNTLKGMKMTVADLLDGFAEVPEGGVVRLAALQADGWVYLRP